MQIKILFVPLKVEIMKILGTFFKDSYSYEINFPQDAEPDIKLTLLNCVYALDALCIY